MMWRMISADESAAKATLPPGMVRRVASYARAYRGQLVGFVLVIVASAVLGLVPPLLFRSIIDGALPAGDQRQLTLLALAVVAASIGSAVLGLIERWWSTRIGEGLIYDLRVALFDHVQRLPIAFFTRSQTGALVSRLNNDVIGAQRAFTGTLGTVVSNVITLLTTLAAMIVLEWRLTILAVLLLPLFILPAKRVGRRLAAITRDAMDLNASMNNTMTERFGVAGALLVKTFGAHDRERADFADRAAKVRDIGVRSAMYSRAFFAILGLVGAIGTAAVYFYGGLQVIDGNITTGTLVAMATLVSRIYEPLTSLTNARVDIMTAFVSFDRVFEVLDAPNPMVDAVDAEPLVKPDGSVEFDHVTFSYRSENATLASLETGPNQHPDDVEVLHDVSFTIAAGTTVALVGPSGAGKSTVAALVNRLYDPEAGSVKVDGRDVRSITTDSLRAAVGVVAQDPHLFHATIAENLRYAAPSATDDDIRQACASAQILTVIDDLPNGFDTVVGDRGYRLSGGEKQRLAIARMLLKDPTIVVLDEATSHLDTENEAAIGLALDEALAGRTALVIAHRLSTIVNSDAIIVLEAGRVVQQGTHGELLEQGGLYRDLYERLVSEPIG